MNAYTPSLAAQTTDLADRLSASIAAASTDLSATVLVPRDLLEDVAGKLRALAHVVDNAAEHTIHFMASSSDQTVVHEILDTNLDGSTMAAARSIIDAALKDDDWVIVNLVRQMPPHGSQQMLIWYLLQSLKGHRQLGDPSDRKQQQILVGAHCTICDTDWDADHLKDAETHSRDENHHVIPTLADA